MSSVVDVKEAEKRPLHFLERAKNGEKIIITKDGIPYAKLMPLVKQKRELGFVEGSVPDGFFDVLPEEELETWQ